MTFWTPKATRALVKPGEDRGPQRFTNDELESVNRVLVMVQREWDERSRRGRYLDAAEMVHLSAKLRAFRDRVAKRG